MVETIRPLTDLLTNMPSGISEAVSAEDIRDMLVSVLGGFGAYEDLATKTTRLNGLAGVRFPYECDGAGVNSDNDHLPYPKVPTTDELWDTTNDRILLANLPEGERISVRLDFILDPSNPNSTVDIFTMFHNSSDAFIFELDHSAAEIKSTGDKSVVIDITFFVGSAIVDGYVYFEILCSNNCTVQIGGVYINIIR